MKIEIHWPLKDKVETVEVFEQSERFRSVLLCDIIGLSYECDVIIDKGKITFVDKE